jgi:hypothetical protein
MAATEPARPDPLRHDQLMDEERNKTEEMRIVQADREREERRRAEDEPTDPGTATHARRADKAAYLRSKLGERAESERRAAEEG